MRFDVRFMRNGLSQLIAAVFIGMNFYAIDIFSNYSVLFGVNFVSGNWSSFIGGLNFLDIPFIYRLFSSWIFQYALFSIAAESRPFFFPIPPAEISYVNTIFTLIYISFYSSFAASLTTCTAASSIFKSSISASFSYSFRLFDLPYLSINSWWWLGCW